jgi:hypothetical protein
MVVIFPWHGAAVVQSFDELIVRHRNSIGNWKLVTFAPPPLGGLFKLGVPHEVQDYQDKALIPSEFWTPPCLGLGGGRICKTSSNSGSEQYNPGSSDSSRMGCKS